MKLYAIRGWDELYENNRSRTVQQLTWVPIPNKHDGENFTNIMAHKDGPLIFTTFILLVQIASKCKPRGVLVRNDGSPHDVSSLSVKCRADVRCLTVGLNYLEHHTDWLDVKEVESGRQVPVRQVPDDCQAGDEEGKEGKEGNGTAAVAATPMDFISKLAAKEVYAGIDVQKEFMKMEQWCEIRRVKPTERRFVNWLNGADKPMVKSINRGPNI